MSDWPLLWTELQPPDTRGNSELHCYLTKRGFLTQPPQVIEDLGRIPYHPYPEKSYESSGWIGEGDERHLEVTLPNGRVLEVCAVASTLAEGKWPEPKHYGKKKRPKKKAAGFSPAAGKGPAAREAGARGRAPSGNPEPKKRQYIQLTLEGMK